MEAGPLDHAQLEQRCADLPGLDRFAARGQVEPASTVGRMAEDLVLQALQGMRTEVAAVNSGIAGLTKMVVSVQESVVSLTADVATLCRRT